MGKRLLIIGFILFLSLMFVAPGYCDTPARKLGRGLCNIGTCPFELALQMSRTNSTDGPMAAMTYGLVKGVGMMCMRAAVGVYETITFPLPYPDDYRPILTDPEFFFEDMNW